MVSERGNENSVTRIDNCFGGVGFDEKVLEDGCVAGMTIEVENNDHIGYRVLLRWSGCDCSDLWRYFGWDDKFVSYRVGGRKREFGVGSHFDGIGIAIHDLVGRISG